MFRARLTFYQITRFSRNTERNVPCPAYNDALKFSDALYRSGAGEITPDGGDRDKLSQRQERFYIGKSCLIEKGRRLYG